jgi:predicted AlkP superfamily pyrophosphatase or phosphodiesterase
MKKMPFAVLILILSTGLLPLASGQTAQHRPLIVLSIDGLRPDYIRDADKYGLKIPTLRRLMQHGVHASGVRGVLPTVTYPSHTTMLTGVWPAKHGIYSNTTFDPYAKNKGGWYWYSEDIRVPTLWEAASGAGYTVGSVSWPVSVSAKGVRYLIPEYWRAMTPDDIKLLRALSTPGLMADLAKSAGGYTTDLDDAIPGDWDRTKYAAAMIREKRVNFLTFHFAAFDHLEHSAGPFSPVALAALEEIDKMVAMLGEAIHSASPNAVVGIVSDHGFAKVDHVFNLDQAFVKAGLITLKAQKDSLADSGVTDWKAAPWPDGGSAAIMLKDPGDASTRGKVKQLLDRLAADPANGIAKILNRSDITALGGDPEAVFWVDMRPGYAIGGALEGPLVHSVSVRGTHGYSPTHPEMRAFFLISGAGIREGADIGDIDMRSVAPTLAKILKISFPTAELPPLSVFSGTQSKASAASK